MSNTATLLSDTSERKLPRIDLRSVIIVAILSFGAGAYTASQPDPANATPATQVTPAAASAAPGK